MAITDWKDAGNNSLPASLAWVQIYCQVAVPQPDSTDEDPRPDILNPTAKIVITPKVKQSSFAGTAQDDSLILAFVPWEIPLNNAGQAYIIDGEAGARLPNTSDPKLNPNSFSWNVKFVFDDPRVKPKVAAFDMTPPPPREDGEPWKLDLTQVARVAATEGNQPEMLRALAAIAWESARTGEKIAADVRQFTEDSKTAAEASAASSASSADSADAAQASAARSASEAATAAAEAAEANARAADAGASAQAAEAAAERAAQQATTSATEATAAKTAAQSAEANLAEVQALAQQMSTDKDTVVAQATQMSTDAAQIKADTAEAKASAAASAADVQTVRQIDESIKAHADTITAQANAIDADRQEIMTIAAQNAADTEEAKAAAAESQRLFEECPVEMKGETTGEEENKTATLYWRHTPVGEDTGQGWETLFDLRAGIDGASPNAASVDEEGILTIGLTKGDPIVATGSTKGPKGDTGRGIHNVTINENLDLVVTYDDPERTQKIAGRAQGDPGETFDRVTNDNGVLTFHRTDGVDIVADGNCRGPVPTIITGTTSYGDTAKVEYVPLEPAGTYRVDTTIQDPGNVNRELIESYLKESPYLQSALDEVMLLTI